MKPCLKALQDSEIHHRQQLWRFWSPAGSPRYYPSCAFGMMGWWVRNEEQSLGLHYVGMCFVQQWTRLTLGALCRVGTQISGGWIVGYKQQITNSILVDLYSCYIFEASCFWSLVLSSSQPGRSGRSFPGQWLGMERPRKSDAGATGIQLQPRFGITHG